MNIDSVKQFVYEDTLTWTMTTNGYKYYTLNLITFLKTIAKVPWKLMIVCCDTESYTFFRREMIPCVLWSGAKPIRQTNLAVFGSEDFKVWNRVKLQLLEWLVVNPVANYTLYLDGDIVVQSDPWPVLKGIWTGDEGIPDLLFQCDCAHAKEHSHLRECSAPCSGMIAQRGSNVSKGLYTLQTAEDKALWKECLEQDQPFIQAKLKQLAIPFGTVPRIQFGNGHWQKEMTWKGQPWILLHYNYRQGNNKRVAMKSSGHWVIPY